MIPNVPFGSTSSKSSPDPLPLGVSRVMPGDGPLHGRGRAAAQRTGPGPKEDQVTLELDVKRPELNVTIRRYTVEMNDEDAIGRIAILIYQDFFQQPRRISQINEEFRTRGWMKGTGRPTPLKLPLSKIAEMGFLHIVGQDTYQAVEGMKVNIKEVRTVA